MKHNHTDITIVLDRSGSMASVANDTIGGFNKFLEGQKAAPGSADISLHQFDHEFETPIKASPIASAQKLTAATFVPRGSTALFDAIGRAIIDTGKRLSDKPDHERAEKVIFVIITDGEENASREYDRAKIMDMITHQREKYAWEFVFLGANQDAMKAGQSLGVSAQNSMTYAANAQGTADVFASVSSNTMQYRCGNSQNMAFGNGDRAKQQAAGASN